MRLCFRRFVPLLFLCSLGCGGKSVPPVVPVSGQVKLDGRPLANATVVFQPIGRAGEPGSSGVTDQEGKFKLQPSIVGISPTIEGATVGEHYVTFSRLDRETSDGVARQWVPAKYNAKDKQKFTVPAGGTSEANFALFSK